MKKLIFTAICFILIASHLSADVHRVNNTGADADFSSAQAAHDAALSGDTLYIEASPGTYGILSISKEIHIFGSGFRLTENQNLQANPSSATLADIRLFTGCSNSSIQGMTITGNIVDWSTSQEFSNVIISRNRIIGGIRFASSNNIDDIFIIGNEIWGTVNGVYSIHTTGTSPKNLIVLNNIFRYSSFAHIYLAPATSAIFTNNIFAGRNIETTACDFQNNILIDGAILNPTLNTFSYNICEGTQFPTGNNNQQNVAEASIFVGWPSIGNYSEDGRFALLNGSPAEGSGNGGIDCGVFAGASSYVLSGIPPIPTIYKLESPNVVTGNFTITLSTRSNN